MELRDLQKMTVVKLREEALKHEGLAGVHVMNKEELLSRPGPPLWHRSRSVHESSPREVCRK